jgi:hypothetical protein
MSDGKASFLCFIIVGIIVGILTLFFIYKVDRAALSKRICYLEQLTEKSTPTMRWLDDCATYKVIFEEGGAVIIREVNEHYFLNGRVVFESGKKGSYKITTFATNVQHFYKIGE